VIARSACVSTVRTASAGRTPESGRHVLSALWSADSAGPGRREVTGKPLLYALLLRDGVSALANRSDPFVPPVSSGTPRPDV
jgi:hypothetical protein